MTDIRNRKSVLRAAVIGLVATVGLTACGGGDTEPADDETETTETETEDAED